MLATTQMFFMVVVAVSADAEVLETTHEFLMVVVAASVDAEVLPLLTRPSWW